MEAFFQLLASNTWYYLILLGIIAACIGSFINMLVVRLPLALEHHWKKECYEFLNLNEVPEAPKLSLMASRSHCPKCMVQIAFYDNIPLLSYLILKGKCRHCHQLIAIRYPLIELLTIVLSVIVGWQLGFNSQGLFAVLITWILLCQSFIDIEKYYIPDELTLPTLWLGLLINLQDTFCPLNDAVLGAIVGYMSLWSMYQLHKFATGREGMGHGDFKLLAMLGAWFGWQILPATIILSALFGIVFFICSMLLQNKNYQQPIPFGPSLAIAGWITMLWGDTINNAYLNWAGFI